MPKLKFGPGNDWIIARPSRKSRGDTQPCVTMYSRSKGMTTGPPPKMMVPARYKSANRENPRGASLMTTCVVIMMMKLKTKKARMAEPNFQDIDGKSARDSRGLSSGFCKSRGGGGSVGYG